MDLPARLQLPVDGAGPMVEVCCLTGRGMETLKEAIKELVWLARSGRNAAGNDQLTSGGAQPRARATGAR
jgi:hypothetical protein